MGDNDKPSNRDVKGDFWTTIPGILTALASFIVAITGLIAALNQAGIFKIPPSPSPTPTTQSPSFKYDPDPTKPFLIQLGSDKTPVSAGDEVDRVKELAKERNLSVRLFKRENFYITTVGFFSSRQEAINFRNIIIQNIPFFKSTNPQIKNIREWCPNYNVSGIYLECLNQQ